MSDESITLTLAGQEMLARVERVLDRFQSETRCESPEAEQLRQALHRHVENHGAVPSTDFPDEGASV